MGKWSFKPKKVGGNKRSIGGAATAAGGLLAGPYGTAAAAASGAYSGGADGEGFSIGGMGGKSGALGQYDVLGRELDKANPWLQADRERKKREEEDRKRAQDLYTQTGLLNKKLNEADTGYKGSFDKASQEYLNQAYASTAGYQNKIKELEDQAKSQANDASQTYTNTIFPEMKNAMEMAKQNASQAMSLEEAGDPNNKVQRAVRDLYDQLGQDVRRQGHQDFGILSALGSQGAAQQFGAAGPMTAGMQGQIYARGQEQAGNAYAKAQQRMFDLQQQGINRGFDQSNWLYEQGQRAGDTYRGSIKDLQNVEHNYNVDQRGFRDELGGYAGDMLGSMQAYNTDRYNMGMLGADIDRQNAYAGTGRDQNALNQLYGADQQASNNAMAAGMANNASKGQFMSSILGMFAGGAGGMGAQGMLRNRQNGGYDPYDYRYEDNYPSGMSGYSSTGYQPNIA